MKLLCRVVEKMEELWLGSLIETIRSSPDGKYETINQVRKLIGDISIEKFEAALEALAKSERGRLTFYGAMGTEVELSKITEGELDVDVRFDIARGKVEFHYSFAFGDWQTNIPGEKLP